MRDFPGRKGRGEPRRNRNRGQRRPRLAAAGSTRRSPLVRRSLRFLWLLTGRPHLLAVFIPCVAEPVLSEVEGRQLWLVNDRLSGARTPHVRSFRLAQEMVTVTPR